MAEAFSVTGGGWMAERFVEAALQHAGIEFGIQQAPTPEGGAPKFHWIIYQAVEQGPQIVGTELYPTWEEAEKACRIEIESGRRAGSAQKP